jgi:hypothetical protein
MNWLGEIARAYFTRWYEPIEDPDKFFAEVGEELAHQVDEFADELAGQARPGEGYLEQAARLLRARAQATEIVLAGTSLLRTCVHGRRRPGRGVRMHGSLPLVARLLIV